MESAARRGSIPIFKYLLRRGFHINATGTNGSALAAASFPGEKDLEDERAEMVLFLISRGADVDGIGSMKGCWSCTPLQGSLINGRPDLAKALIQAGADPNLCGNTKIACSQVAPIKLASLVGDVSTVQLLLRAGADPNTTFAKDHSIHHRQSLGHLSCPLFASVEAL
jgi:ankyrin repeat protein